MCIWRLLWIEPVIFFNGNGTQVARRINVSISVETENNLVKAKKKKTTIKNQILIRRNISHSSGVNTFACKTKVKARKTINTSKCNPVWFQNASKKEENIWEKQTQHTMSVGRLASIRWCFYVVQTIKTHIKLENGHFDF